MPSAPSATTAPLTDGEYDTLNDILADVAQRAEGTVPEDWEYCDGFLTALLCMRRAVPPSEYFPVLFGAEPGSAIGLGMVPFRDTAQMQTFVQLWQRRRDEIATALEQPVEELHDPRTLQPAWQDLRGWAAGLDETARHELLRELDAPLPPIGQFWAVGFTDVVQAWPDDWKPPRQRELARAWREALARIEALLDDDADTPLPPEDDGTPVGYSAQRLQRLGEAIWAAYDLYDIARELGPPVAPVRQAAQPGRNDPCPCGSGQKFKKCCSVRA